MFADEDGVAPLIGTTGRYLGARPNFDLPVGPDGFVEPGTEGVSVSPPPVGNLPRIRRPREHGGDGKDPVFFIDTDDLPDELVYRPDPSAPERHGFIEPSRRMPFEDYERAIHATRRLWYPDVWRELL